MLHVKALLTEERRLVTVLVDTRSSCNVLQKEYYRKHGMMIQPCKKELIDFNYSISFALGFVNVLVVIKKWKAFIPFYVLDYRTNLVVEYLGLKALRLSVNCVLDNLVGAMRTECCVML